MTAARVRSRSLKALNVFQPIPVMQASAGHCQEEELGYSLVSSSLISTALWAKLLGSRAPSERQRIHTVFAIKSPGTLRVKYSLKLDLQVLNTLTWAAPSGSRKQTLIKEPNRMFCLDNCRSCGKEYMFSKSNLLNEGQ